MRFAVEVATAVREEWPGDKPVFFRLSAVDGKGAAGHWKTQLHWPQLYAM